jgi:hypothetical protein
LANEHDGVEDQQHDECGAWWHVAERWQLDREDEDVPGGRLWEKGKKESQVFTSLRTTPARVRRMPAGSASRLPARRVIAPHFGRRPEWDRSNTSATMTRAHEASM